MSALMVRPEDEVRPGAAAAIVHSKAWVSGVEVCQLTCRGKLTSQEFT